MKRAMTQGGRDPEEEAPMPGRQEMPSTLERSSEEAQRTWIKAHDAAVQEYGEGERAHRTAFGAPRRAGPR
jgi:uncharacterized protein YecT (DUF1311 family)